MIAGKATAEGTARYRSRFPKFGQAGHFRRPEHVPHLSDLWFSSIGIGTYLGEPDADTDQRYADAIFDALQSGTNVLDTAINYRFQRSERNVGSALARATGDASARRDELVVCTKAGYLTYDGTVPADPRRYFISEYLESQLIPSGELVGGMHCISPSYLCNQIERSRSNLGVETIDVFYIHNPEQQLGEISRDVFHERLKAAFAALEQEIADGRIKVYGTATWNGYRQSPTSREHLDLAEMEKLAREVGGLDHHFRAIQLPFNLGLLEAFAAENQQGKSGSVSTLQLAHDLGIAVVASASLMQGRLAGRLPQSVREKLNTSSDAEAAIQFARSTPGITTALIGMSRREHVEGNLQIASQPLATRESWDSLFA
jgi:aryl-alcohol dehydrogenase-like predicted oxidoreductase